MDAAPLPADALKRGRWGCHRWALVVLLLLAWALRLPPLLADRFHADEALYGYWGLLIGRGGDPWLATVPVYKPPLLSYLIAGVQALFGNSEFSVRWPGLAAGLLAVPLIAALSHMLYRDRQVAIGAAAGVALSPFAILFSATAFTDPLMVALGLGASLAAARGRPGWAGFLAGLSFATKQAGLVWVPMAVGLQVCKSANRQMPASTPVGKSANRHSSFAICYLPFAICFLLVAGLVFAWDQVRIAQGAESFWDMGVTGYGGLRLIWPQELWARLRDWAKLAGYLYASPVVNGLLPVGLALLVWRAITSRRCRPDSLCDLLLISFSLAYFLFHWLWAFPVWDRYLLPLVPLAAILLGRTTTLFASYLRATTDRLIPANRQSPFSILRSLSSNLHLPFAICYLSFIALLLLPAWNAAHSRYPVGGDHGAYDGIDEVAAFLRALPEGTVVYQHWLGWHYAYYLFDAPVYVAYWPTPAWLAQDVQVFGRREPRYIAFPSWESPARVAWALAGAGYELAPALTTTRRDGTPSFTVYRIQPEPNP